MIIKNSEMKGYGLGSTLSKFNNHIYNEEKHQIMRDIFQNKKDELEEEHGCSCSENNEQQEDISMNKRFIMNMNYTLEMIDDIISMANKEFNRVDEFGSFFFISPHEIEKNNYTISMLLEENDREDEINRETEVQRAEFLYETLSDHGIEMELLKSAIFYYYHNRENEDCYEMMNLLIPEEK